MPWCLCQRILSVVLAASLGCAAATPSHAQTGERPDAGQLTRQLRGPMLPIVPSRELDISESTAPGPTLRLPPGPRFEVRAVEFEGRTALPLDQLRALVADCIGPAVSLADLQVCTARITERYRAQGYHVARAYVPAQTVDDGKLRITILEGRLGAVRLHNESPVAAERLERIVAANACADAPSCGQALVRFAALERTLLLVNDLPGLSARGQLAPGDGVGTADFSMDVSQGPPRDGFAVVDNHGSAATGRHRLRAGLTLYEPAGLGDRLTLQALTSGDGLSQASVAYEWLASDRGARAGVSAGRLHYRLQGAFEATRGRGDADDLAATASYPLVRSRLANLTVQAALTEHRFSDDNLPEIGRTTHKRTRVASIGLSGSNVADAESAVVDAALLVFSAGHLALDAALTSMDEPALRTRGGFQKVNLALSRRVGWASGAEWLASLSAQWAGGNLDSSEKMPLGGPDGVRAALAGDGPGDMAVLASTEWRVPVPMPDRAGVLQAVAFWDWGQSLLNKRPSLPIGNKVTLGGPGAGFRYVHTSGWIATATVAQLREGGLLGTDDGQPWRIWLAFDARF